MRIWTLAGCEYDERSGVLWVHGNAARLGDTVRRVLVALLEAPNHSCSKPALRDLWDPSASDDSVKNAISQLRSSFQRLGEREEVIRTVHGWGYRLVVPVTVRDFDPRSTWAEIKKDAPAPGLPGWTLHLPMEPGAHCHVWQIRSPGASQVRVVKYALDSQRRGRLRRELRAWEAFERALPSQRGFVRAISSHVTTFPCLVEWEYGGENLAVWTENQRRNAGLSRELCLRIAIDIADTLAEAHSLGIVHNDLKPANILLSPSSGPSGRWQVRIADFGIASVVQGNRLAEFQLGDRTLLPGPDAAGGTASYRAPEANAHTLPTPERDVYALGVILFQLLCGDFGKTPGPGWQDEVADPLLQADLNAACNIDPARRPRAAEFAEQLRTLERRRQDAAAEEAERHARAERLRTLEEENRHKEQQLAAELAQKPFRNALIGVLALLLVAIAVAAAIQVHSLRQARDRARAEAHQSETLQKFFEGLFFDGDAPIHGAITPQALVERGVDKSRLLEREPRVHATLLRILGEWFADLGDFPKAEQLLARSLDERRRTFGADSPEVADTLVQQAALLNAEHRSREALQLAQQALAIQQAKLPKDDIEISRTEDTMAEILTELGEYDRSVPLLQAVIARTQGHADLLPDLSTAVNNLGVVENYRGHLERSIQLQEQGMQIDRSLEGDRHPDIAEHLISIANDHDLLGDYADAVKESREALSIEQEWLPPGHHEVAAAHAHLGAELAHIPQSRAEARSHLETALDVLRKEPERSRTEAYALLALAGLDQDDRRTADALAAYQDALRIYRKLYPPTDPALVVALNGVASMSKQLQDWAEMEKDAGEAYRIATATMPAGDPRRLAATINQARSLAHQHQREQAIALDRVVLQTAPADKSESWIRETATSDLDQLSHSS